MKSNLRAVTSCLAEDQVREAEALFRRLADGKRTLSFCVDFALTNHREPEHQKALDEAVFGLDRRRSGFAPRCKGRRGQGEISQR